MDLRKFLCAKGGGGYSKAQMCLQKILRTICSIPPHHQQNPEPKLSFHDHRALDSSPSSNSEEKVEPFGHRGFPIDLNLELTCSSPQTDDNSTSLGIDSSAAKSNQEKSEKQENFFEQRTKPVSETDVEDHKNIKATVAFWYKEFGQTEGPLPSVTEAGELSSENAELQRGELGTEFGTQEAKGKGSMEEGGERWVVDLYGRFEDEVSQVARTKRTRRRVLPCRYKDSVLQPLARNRKRQRLKRTKPVSETDVEDKKNINATVAFCYKEFGQKGGPSPSVTEAGELSSENAELQRGELGTEFGTQETKGKGSMEEGEERWVMDLYGRFEGEVSQVARTKRTRRRVLPCRYKDSVLQLLARNRKRQRLKVMKSA